MSQFIVVDRHWINLDLVTRIELVESRKTAGTTAVARVHFCNGKHFDFKREDSIRELEEFLENHRAT